MFIMVLDISESYYKWTDSQFYTSILRTVGQSLGVHYEKKSFIKKSISQIGTDKLTNSQGEFL